MRSTHKTEAEAVRDFLANSEEFKRLQAFAKHEKPVTDYANLPDEPVIEVRSCPQQRLVEQLERTRTFSTIIESTDPNYGTSFLKKIFNFGSFFDPKSNFSRELTQMRQKAKEYSSQETFAAGPAKVTFK